MLRVKGKGDKLFYVVCNCRRNFSCSRLLSLTHYDVLNLKKDCSQKEIRNAYIKLCKENHPDCDKANTTLHNKFLRINEAYNVLSKPETRRRYDATIAYLGDDRKIRSVFVDEDNPTEEYRRAWSDPIFYHNRKEEFMNARQVPDDEYYGIKGIKRVSNATFFVILVATSLISGFVQIIAIKNSLTERNRISDETGMILQNLREKVAAQTEEENIRDIERSYYENLAILDPHYKKEDHEK